MNIFALNIYTLLKRKSNISVKQYEYFETKQNNNGNDEMGKQYRKLEKKQMKKKIE